MTPGVQDRVANGCGFGACTTQVASEDPEGEVRKVSSGKTGPCAKGDGVRARVERDDRIFVVTRAVAVVVILILVLATDVLNFDPGRTATRFPWTIPSHMTCFVMGSGYGSAVYFFIRVLTGRRWHRVHLGFAPTTAFVTLLLASTLLHSGKFHHGTFPFELWFVVYLVTPVVIPALWAWNHRTDPRELEPADARLPDAVRLALVVTGLAMAAVTAIVFVRPSLAIPVWPWPLTPLTARAVAAFIALPAVAWLAMAADSRWSACRIPIETVGLGLVLLLIGVARAWSEFDTSRLLTYVYVVGLSATLVSVTALWLWMNHSVRRSAPG
jgi:hypothetical protein